MHLIPHTTSGGPYTFGHGLWPCSIVDYTSAPPTEGVLLVVRIRETSASVSLPQAHAHDRECIGFMPVTVLLLRIRFDDMPN